jgi:serine/threonine-protein kinase HipA
LAPGYRPILVKFASRTDPADAGPIEYAYAQMAHAAGIDMMPTFLLHGSGRGPGYFATERFDWRDGRRWHVHTLSGLLHADYRLPSLDYESALRATLHLTRDQREVMRLYRLMVFNVLAHNRDDHARQFSFLMDPGGVWRLSPAYDLTFSEGPGGEHATTVAGEGRAPEQTHFVKVAQLLGDRPSQAMQIVEEVREAVARWPGIAADAGVSRASRSRIWAILKKGTRTVLAK